MKKVVRLNENDIERLIRKIISEEKKSIKENINNTNTLEDYARIMNKTADYPWTRNAGNTEEADKMEKVNNSVKKKFEQLFYETFPKDVTKIVTNNGSYSFHVIKFNANYTNYSLIFKNNSSMVNYLWLKPERSGYHVDSQNIKITDKTSDDLINKMLDYNSVRNKNTTM